MIVFERRDPSRVWRMRCAFAMALFLSQSAWVSAQEPTSDAPRLRSTGGTVADQRDEREGVPAPPKDTGVRWGRVVSQTLSFQAIQHAFLLTEPKARGALRGPWVQDWFESAASPFVEPHWSDGGTFFVNYIAHPMGGSVYANIYRQNNPSAMRLQFGQDGYAAQLAK